MKAKNKNLLLSVITIIFAIAFSVALAWSFYGGARMNIAVADETEAVYDEVTIEDLNGLSVSGGSYSFTATNDEVRTTFTPSSNNTTNSVVFGFNYVTTDITEANNRLEIRIGNTIWGGYTFFFTEDRIWNEQLNVNAMGALKANETLYIEMGVIRQADGNAHIFVKVDDVAVIDGTVAQNATWTTNNINFYAGGTGTKTLSVRQTTDTNEQLVTYDTVSVKDVFGETVHTVNATSSDYDERSGAYTGSSENTTGSVAFKFKLNVGNAVGVERLVQLRQNGTNSYRFYLWSNGIKLHCFINGAFDTGSDVYDWGAKEESEYEVELGAIDIKDTTKVWQYVKLDGELVLSRKVEAIATATTKTITVGGNDSAPWMLTDLREEEPIKTGISMEKSSAYENVQVKNLEDLMADVSYLNIGFGAAQTENNNIKLEKKEGEDRTPIIELKPKENVKWAYNLGIKFASVNTCVAADEAETSLDPIAQRDMKKDTAIELGLELCATSMGAYWTQGMGYLAYLVWDPGAGSYNVTFFPEGPAGTTVGVAVARLQSHPNFSEDFLPIGEKYTIEYGLFSADIEKSLTMYVCITNSAGKEIYVENTWAAADIKETATTGGYVRIAKLPYVCSSAVELMSVDSETTLLAKYEPVYKEAESIVDHDISDYLPIGQDGITYTTTSKEDTKDIINVRKFIVNSKNEMYLRFSGDYNLRLAFFTDRSDGNCSAGYHVVFVPGNITVESFLSGSAQISKRADYNFTENEKTHVSIKAVQLYVEGILKAVRITVYVDGESIVSGDFALQLATLPTYFDGIMSGNGSVTIYPYDQNVTADIGIEMNLAKKKIDIDKQVKLDYKIGKEIIGDSVTYSYKIVDGESYAELKQNSNGATYLVGKANGKVKVSAVVTTEYGTFESEVVEITVGTGIAEVPSESSSRNSSLDSTTSSGNSTTDSTTSNEEMLFGCFGSLETLSFSMVFLLAVAVYFVAKKKEDR